jgi:hypothetical protein
MSPPVPVRANTRRPSASVARPHAVVKKPGPASYAHSSIVTRMVLNSHSLITPPDCSASMTNLYRRPWQPADVTDVNVES